MSHSWEVSLKATLLALESRENVSLSYVLQSLVHEEKKFSGKFRQQTTGSSAANEGTSALVGGYRLRTRGRRPVCFECQEEARFRRDYPKLASASKHELNQLNCQALSLISRRLVHSQHHKHLQTGNDG